MRVVFTPHAEEDLGQIGDYIAQDNPARALSFLAELRSHCERIGLAPLACPARSELGEHLRSCAHGHYTIFFQPGKERVLIVRVLHGARDVTRILGSG